MIYLIALSLTTFVLAFALKLLITYFFIKFFNREKNFWVIFKPILLYELGAFCLFIINPVSLIYLLTPILPRIFLFLLYFLISAVILFLIFKFIMERFSLLNFKKSLLIFFVMFVIVTPIIFYSKVIIESKVAEKLLVFEKWSYKKEVFPQILFQKFRPKSPSEILLEKIDRLNDIFLEGEFVKGLRNFLITI